MRYFRFSFFILALGILSGCGNSSSPKNTLPPAGSSSLSISLRDMPPMGMTVLSFQVNVTGMAMQPGNVSLLSSPMQMELTQLQSMAAYMNTVSVPAGTYTSMTMTFANPRMTFLNTSGGMMSMMNGNCLSGQICEITPTMMASSATISGAPFPLSVQDNMPLGMLMDFDLMSSMQQNMSVNPTMSSMIEQAGAGSGAFDRMDGLVGKVSAVNAANNQFSMQLMQGMPSMTVAVDSNTVFENFGAISQPNNFSSLAVGQIVEVEMELRSGGTLYADEVRFESASSSELAGMIVALDNSSEFDVVVTNEAPAIPGISMGDVMRMNVQPGAAFDVDDQDMPVSGMSFAGMTDLMVGQVVQMEPLTAPTSGTPPVVNVDHVRLMQSWMTATVAAKLNATDFTVNGLSGLFTSAGISTMHVSTSSQTEFQNMSGMSGMNVSDTVSLRGPMFWSGGNPTLIASCVHKR